MTVCSKEQKTLFVFDGPSRSLIFLQDTALYKNRKHRLGAKHQTMTQQNPASVLSVV